MCGTLQSECCHMYFLCIHSCFPSVCVCWRFTSGLVGILWYRLRVKLLKWVEECMQERFFLGRSGGQVCCSVCFQGKKKGKGCCVFLSSARELDLWRVWGKWIGMNEFEYMKNLLGDCGLWIKYHLCFLRWFLDFLCLW